VYLQRQFNNTLDTFSNCTLLRIKVIRASSVLELQGADECTIWDHSKNCSPCHLSNLDPTIIMSTWIPPLDYPCQVCQKIDDANQMLLCDNCNGGYHLFCLKPELTQVPAGIWYCLSRSPAAPWFLFKPWHTFPDSGLRGDTWEFHLSLFLCIIYIYMCVHIIWLISFYLWLVLVFLFSRVSYGFTALQHYMSQHYTSQHSHGSLSLSFVMKVMVCHFVNNSHEVMTALIVVLPLIVVVEISLQLHQSLLLSFMWICWYCLKNYWQRNKWQCKKWE
jgi:hypothetical protein